MWELLRLTSRGGNSARRIFTYALAALTAVFLWTLLSFNTVQAAETTATRNGESFMYSGQQYYSAGLAVAGDSHNLPAESPFYTRIETVTERPLLQKAHVIYFAPGSDPGTATTANYVVYDFADRVFSNPSGTIAITISDTTDIAASSCAIDGIGWAVCSISVWIAQGMDYLLNVIQEFMEVQPPTVGDTTDDMYMAWNAIRGIANVAFIIVFILIIYSQLTTLGLTNYGIKKLLPRLIIAAILVNVSYFICAIAIDISNVIGFSIQDLFTSMRNNLFNVDQATWTADVVSVESWTSFVLSGGSAAIAGGGGLLIATGGSIVSAIFLLFPALVGLMLAVLVAILILAARQAIITILLIISPLAFVAYLLPNTEKWFTKWRELFMTMLIFFPAFAAVFGGAQLAGGVIIQNATSFNIIILGLIVQLAPLAISPLLLKLSGSLLGKIASLANTPNKKIMDATRGWSNNRAEMYKNRALGNENLKWYNGARRSAQFFDNRARRVKERSELYGNMADNRYNATRGHQELFEQAHHVEERKHSLEHTLKRDLDIKIRNDAHLLQEDMEARLLADEAASAKAMLDKVHEDMRAGVDTSPGAALTALTARSQVATRDLALTAIASQTAKRVQQNQLSTALLENTAELDGQLVRAYAGAVDGADGERSALTFAVNQKREAENKLISEHTQLIKHFELDGAQRQTLAEGKNYVATKGGISYEFIGSDDFAREAAIELQLKTGSYAEIESLVSLSGIADGAVDAQGRVGARKFAQTIGDAVYSNGLGNKGHFLSGQFINDIASGRVAGEAGLNDGVTLGIMEGKFKPEELANNDPGAIRRYIKVAENALNGNFEPRADTPEKRRKMLANIQLLKTYASQIIDPTIDVGNNASGATKTILEELANL